MKWYASCLKPTASVQDSGMSRPMKCPSATKRMPKWNSGEPRRRIVFSYSSEDRVVQPNLS